MKLRRIAVTLALAAATIVSPLGNAKPSAASAEQMRKLIADHVPVDALHAKVDRSSGEPEFTAPDRPRSPSEIFLGAMQGNADALKNPRTIARTQDSFLEFVTGEEVLDLGTLREASGPSAAMVSETAIEDREFAWPVADLDGNGLADAVQVRWSWNASTYELVSVKLEGLSGLTGAKLWAKDLTGAYDFFLMQGADLNSDGSGDLTLIELYLGEENIVGPCTFAVCVADGSFTWRFDVTTLSGPTGSPLWSKSYPGYIQSTFEFTNALVAFQYAERFKVINGVVAPSIRGNDMVVNAFDFDGIFGLQYAGAVVAFGLAAEEVVGVTTRAEVVDGASGSVLHSRTKQDQMGGSWLIPVGQAVGDTTEDLIWYQNEAISPVFACAGVLFGVCAGPGKMSVELEMIDGANFASAWKTSLSDPTQDLAGAWPTGADVNADGSLDLFWYQYLIGGLRQGVISGADGGIMWSKDGDSYLRTVGPVGGAPGADVVAVAYLETETGYAVDLARLDGPTGSQMFVTHHGPQAGFEYSDYWVFTFGDADGDDVADLMVEEFAVRAGDFEINYLLESGATGSVITTRSGWDSFLLRAGDLDANGTDDGLSVAIRTVGASDEVTLTAYSLPSDTSMWARTELFDASSWWGLGLSRAGDMFGDGGGDFISNQYQELRKVQSRVVAIDGRTGGTVWTLGDTFDPPVVSTGAISGVVTETGGPALEDMCVELEGWSLYFYSETRTGSDGSYTFSALRDGLYVVRFHDCGRGTHRSEFYNDKQYYSDANLVSVDAGGIVSGVDAALTPLVNPSELSLVREQERGYIGVAGDFFVSGPIPGGIYNDCTEDGPSIGGTCFELNPGELAIQLNITDDSGDVVAGYYQFSDDGLPMPTSFGYGYFCGSTDRILVPEGAKLLWVFTQNLRGLVDCEANTVPTTGRVKASFFA